MFDPGILKFFGHNSAIFCFREKFIVPTYSPKLAKSCAYFYVVKRRLELTLEKKVNFKDPYYFCQFYGNC